MDILKTFSLLQRDGNDKIHEINIQGTIEAPLFQANQIGNLLGIKNIRSHIKDFNDDERGVDTVYTLGGPQEVVFLTELGLYRLLGRSKKPIAATFQKWMIRTIREIRITGQYQSKKDNEVDRRMMEYQYGLKTHASLLNLFDQKNVVYIIKLQDDEEEDGRFIIKIGHTENIKERVQNIFSNYNTENLLLLDVFEVSRNCKCEKQIRDDEFMKSLRHSDNVKKNNEPSRETYSVNAEEYDMVIKIMTKIKESFDSLSSSETPEMLKLKIHLEQQKQESIRMQGEYNIKHQELKLHAREIELELTKTHISQCGVGMGGGGEKSFEEEEDEEDEEEEKEEGDGDDLSRIKKRNHGIKTPLVYQYDPSDLKKWIKVWDSPSDVKRSMESITDSRLRNVAKNNTIYKGYRWFFVKRTDSPPTAGIAPTVPNKNKSPDVRYIAMIDIKKTRIMEVFKNQKEAVESRNMKSNSFTRAIINQSVSSGHYWNFFEACPQEMQDAYLSHSKLPEKYVSATGKQVEQIDHKTKKVLKTYSSISEVCKLFQMSVITLKKVMKNEEIHQGYKWRQIN